VIVQVTGSRFASPGEHARAVRLALLWAVGARDGKFGDHELWDGWASGIDEVCHTLAEQDFGWKTERFAADWRTCDPDWIDPLGKAARCSSSHRRKRSDAVTEYCPTAGFRRNQLMINRLAHEAVGRKVVVGFPIPSLGSRGTIDCLTRALHAGLPVISIPLASRDAR
jgi:hypothetical protein